MNILVLNYEFPPLGGGAAPVSHEISKGYVGLGHSVDVITMHYKGLPSFEIIDGIYVHRINCLRKKKELCETYEMLSFIFSAMFFLRNFMKVKRYDICHCHFIIPTGILALWVKKYFGLDYVVTCHGSDIPGYNPDRFQLQHKFTKPLLQIICNNSKQVCSPSLYLSELTKKNIGCFDIKHIPNGIDLSNFQLDLSRPKKNIILSTGRLLKRKGFHTLIKAVHGVALPFEVHIAGDGPYRKELEQMAQGSKTKIVFHGWIEKGSMELLALYERASIYVLASSRENASISLLEGMAAKTVVITTNVSGCPETVGDVGFLIDYDDSKRLQEILTMLSARPQIIKIFSEKAYRRVTDKFLWDKIIDHYIKVMA
jgi:glycosyltransferase involved in cell wall biosynthesis